MKIKISILDSNISFIKHFSSVLSTRYSDQFEIYSFTNYDDAMRAFDQYRIDVFLVDNRFNIIPEELPAGCSLVFLTDSNTVEKYNGCHSLYRYQKIELIYKQILNIYAERVGDITGRRINDNCKVLAFSSPCGGVGTSCMAAACAIHFAVQRKNVLFLNFEKFGVSDIFFNAAGQWDMSDLIFSLKNNEANLMIKLESFIRRDEKTGVSFLAGAHYALHMNELTSDDICRLIDEITLKSTFDYVIIDKDFSLDPGSMNVFRQAHGCIWVSDGSEIANLKIKRAYGALKESEKNEASPLTQRLCLAYNRFSNKSSKAIDIADIRSVGGAQRFDHATPLQIVWQLSGQDFFERMVYSNGY